MTTAFARIALVLAALATSAATSSAQAAPVAGDTVRVFGATRTPLVGVLRTVHAASLAVETAGPVWTINLPRDQVTRIEVLRGHPRRGVTAVLKGMLIGGVAGALAGSVVARAKGEHGELAGIAVIGGGAVGTILGTSVGLYAAFTRHDRWAPADIPTPALTERR